MPLGVSFPWGNEQQGQEILFLFHNQSVCGSLNAFTLCTTASQKESATVRWSSDSPLKMTLSLPVSCVSKGSKESILFIPCQATFLLCFPCRIFPSSIVLQTMRCVGVSGNGKIGLRVINTKSSPQIYINMTNTHEEILVNMVYPLRLCSISD